MKNNYYKLISVNVCDAKVELEWFYFDGTTWTGVSMIEQSIPVPAWATAVTSRTLSAMWRSLTTKCLQFVASN